MRIIAITALCVLCAAPVQAQQVQRIKADGPNAAGICAGSLDMLGQFMLKSPTPDPRKVEEVRIARDFFADLPRYPTTEIAAAATSFVSLMSKRILDAPTVPQREAVLRELVTISKGCVGSMRLGNRNPSTAQPQPAPVTPTVPLATTPLPYVNEPLVLDPVVPAQ